MNTGGSCSDRDKSIAPILYSRVRLRHPPSVPAGPSPSRKGERIYEPITVEVDRGYGDGTYRLHSINFTGRLVQLIEEGYTTMRLYEWVDRGYVVYLVHVEEDKSGRLPRRTLYPFINTHFGRVTPTKGYTAEEVSRAYPEFANGKFLGRPRSSPTR